MLAYHKSHRHELLSYALKEFYFDVIFMNEYFTFLLLIITEKNYLRKTSKFKIIKSNNIIFKSEFHLTLILNKVNIFNLWFC